MSDLQKSVRCRIEEYFDSVAGSYDAEIRKEAGYSAPRLAYKMLAPCLKPHACILDAGIGTGLASERFLKAGFRVCGVDVSCEMLNKTCTKYPGMELFQADIEKELSCLGNRRFDAVLAVGVFEFITDIRRALGNIAGCMTPDGLLCMTFDEYFSREDGRRLRKTDEKRNLISSSGALPPLPAYRYLSSEIKRYLELSGFTPIRTRRFKAYRFHRRSVPVYYTMVLAGFSGGRA